jgi:hypothetical protein
MAIALNIETIEDSNRRCAHCGAPLFSVQPAIRYCSNRCKCRARRRRERGVPEHAFMYPEIGRRGRLRMDEPPKDERARRGRD